MTNSGGDRTMAWREAARAAGRTGARVLIAGSAMAIAGLMPSSAAPAFADADLTVGNGDKVRGTVNPSSERERYYVRLPVGAPDSDVFDQGQQTNVPAAGLAFIFSGASGLGGGDAATDAFRRLDAFPEPQARRGSSLGIGQYFADPIRDLLIGEPGLTGDSGPDAGGVKLLRGGSDIGFGYQSATTDEAGARRGARILPPVDLDRDGRRDMIWSEPGASSGAGAISIRLGPGLFEGRALRLLGSPGTRFGGD